MFFVTCFMLVFIRLLLAALLLGEIQIAVAQSHKQPIAMLCAPIRFAPITYEADTAGSLCIIPTTDRENGSYHGSIWLLKHAIGFTEILGIASENMTCADSSGIVQTVYEMAVSEGSLYLAIESGGEGATWIDIIDLQHLLATKRVRVLRSFAAFPGIVRVGHWKKGKLLVYADINLLRLNDGLPLGFEDRYEEDKAFWYDPKTEKYSIDKK